MSPTEKRRRASVRTLSTFGSKLEGSACTHHHVGRNSREPRNFLPSRPSRIALAEWAFMPTILRSLPSTAMNVAGSRNWKKHHALRQFFERDTSPALIGDIDGTSGLAYGSHDEHENMPI